MMKSISAIIFLLLTMARPSYSQTKYELACTDLNNAVFHNSFDLVNVESKLQGLLTLMDALAEEEFLSCNCADSIWISLLRNQTRFISYTHSNVMDTNVYLRHLPTILDVSNLKQEFRYHELPTLQDSLNYVLDRLASKDASRNSPEYNWQNFYHCIEAEMSFLVDHKYQLKAYYFDIFDDTLNSYDLRDLILVSMFHSNASIEIDILSRIDSYIGQRHFYRMLGILRTSGSDQSLMHLIKILETHEFDLNTKKSILQTLYGISDQIKPKRSSKMSFEKFLSASQLDSLSRYDLFLRD